MATNIDLIMPSPDELRALREQARAVSATLGVAIVQIGVYLCDERPLRRDLRMVVWADSKGLLYRYDTLERWEPSGTVRSETVLGMDEQVGQ